MKGNKQYSILITLVVLLSINFPTFGQEKKPTDSLAWKVNQLGSSHANLSSMLDSDNDGIVDASDNCPTTWNPQQKDINQNGIGDPCDPNTKIISFFENTTIGFGYSTEFLFQERLNIDTLIEETKTFVLRNDTIFLEKALNYENKDYYRSKMVRNNSTMDTLDVLIFMDFVIKDYIGNYEIKLTGE